MSGKRERDPGPGTLRDPADGASGDAPMTGAQVSYLRMLSQEALEPEAFNTRLTRAEAARRIETLKAKIRLQDGPPHTL